MALSPDHLTSAISSITGQVHALFMFSQALAKTHPEPKALLAEFDDASQVGLADIEWLSTARTDAIEGGFQHIAKALREILQAAAEIPPRSDGSA
jgi:hypothetical protein